MRKLRLFLLIFIVMLMALPLSAQDLKITKIEASRLSKALIDRVTDPISGEECAVLHIKTEGLTPEERDQLDFQLDQASTIARTLKDGGEILMYVPPRTVLLVVKSPFGNYRADFRRDFGFPSGTVKLKDYDVYIEYNRPAPGPVVPEKTMYNYLIVKADQENAMIYIDDTFVGTGSVSKSFKVGETHRWRIECSLYHDESGEASITEGEKVKVEKTLRPAFGFINITSTPENGASVLVDGNFVGTTPFKTDRIASGEHKVRVMKEMYSTAEKTVTVTDGNTTQVAIALSANFVNATVTTDSEADIYIDSELMGKGRWTGRLSDGSHTFEARRASHRPSFKNVTLTLGKDENITIPNPEPIYGTLDVNSSPMGATITIDGRNCGVTPKVLYDILIGTHELKLEKSGCATVTKTITLDEKNLLAVNEKLQTGREISISTDKQGDQLYADGNYLGASPLTATLTFGTHTIKAVRDSKAVEKTITVSQTGGDSSVRLEFSGNKTFTIKGISFEMVAVKGGTFTMGASSGDSYAESDEKPTHSVTLSDYYIGKFEVTQELWEAVMGSNPSYFKGNKLPVEQVSWDDCQTFIRKLNSLTGANFRLPTEAEWEYAARAGSEKSLYGNENIVVNGTNNSPNLDRYGWYGGNCGQHYTASEGCDESKGYDISGWEAKQYGDKRGGTHPVGRKTPNAWGIYDMLGNVYEWCQDWYGSYGSGSQTNPQGPLSGSPRVLRGGSWYYRASYCRVSNRSDNYPGDWGNYYGLRLALVL